MSFFHLPYMHRFWDLQFSLVVFNHKHLGLAIRRQSAFLFLYFFFKFNFLSPIQLRYTSTSRTQEVLGNLLSLCSFFSASCLFKVIISLRSNPWLTNWSVRFVVGGWTASPFLVFLHILHGYIYKHIHEYISTHTHSYVHCNTHTHVSDSIVPC